MPKERAELVLKILNKIDKVCRESGYGVIEIYMTEKKVTGMDMKIKESMNYDFNKNT